MMRTLRVTSGPLSGHSVEVERDLVIGRQEADLTIPDSELSRRHVVVRPVETGVIVEDLGSLNGTFVDDERIDHPVTLTADTTIRVGRSVIALELDLAPAPSPAGAADGRTRLATPVVSAPEPPPDEPATPPVTRVRPVPESVRAGDEAPPAIPEPGVTRVRPAVPGPEPTPPVEAEDGPPVNAPAVTRVRPIAVQADPLPIVAPAVTRVRPVPDIDGPPTPEPTAPEAPAPEAPAPGAPAADPAPDSPKGLRGLLRGLFRRGRP